MIYVNITNSLTTKARTGIQRVVKELVKRLRTSDRYQFVAYSENSFYKVEQAVLWQQYFLCKDVFLNEPFSLDDIVEGDVFLDIDASWGDPYDASMLYRNLKLKRVTLVKVHYDAVPILFPKFSHENTRFRYIDNFSAALMYVDFWICISETVKRDLERISKSLKLAKPVVSVIDLGADLPLDLTAKELTKNINFKEITRKNLIISVGTVEPRKNYELVLDSYDYLVATKSVEVNLVIVGKNGWNNESIVGRIKNHPLFGRGVYWLDSATDTDLAYLYKKAKVCLCLSHYEGYGLPVVEAALHNVPVICPRDTAMAEVGGPNITLVDYNAVNVASAVFEVLNQRRSEVFHYIPTSWDESAEQIKRIIDEKTSSASLGFMPKQAVYISIRPDALSISVASIVENMRFVEEIVVLTNDRFFKEIKKELGSLGVKFVLLSESELGLNTLPEDHQKRNTLLRKTLYSHDLIDSNFIAFDDDCFVAREVKVENFLNDGKHIGYYFYNNGLDWLGAFPKPTSFDEGIWRTSVFLKKSGYDLKLYNSHQPQIINKDLAVRILNHTDGLALDEWSSYFNIAKHLFPSVFVDAPYQAAGWPPNFDSWLPSVKPNILAFYNEPSCGVSDIDEAVNIWSEELDRVMSNDSLYIHFEGDKLLLSKKSINVLRGSVVCIPVYSSSLIENICYNFLGSDISFDGDTIPNFLHVPTAKAESLKEFVLEVEVNGFSDTVLVGLSE